MGRNGPFGEARWTVSKRAGRLPENVKTHKLATYRVKKDAVEKARATVAAFVDEVGRKEGGTARYEVWQHVDDPARFTHYMIFNTPAADKYHATTAWVKKFNDTMAPLYETPPVSSEVRPVP